MLVTAHLTRGCKETPKNVEHYFYLLVFVSLRRELTEFLTCLYDPYQHVLVLLYVGLPFLKLLSSPAVGEKVKKFLGISNRKQ